MPLLHGILDVYVHQATDLTSTYRIQVVGCMKRYVCCGQLPTLSGSCDPYLCLDVGSTRRLRTRFIEGTHNPVWDERFEVYLADEADTIKLTVKDADVVGSDFLGQAVIPVWEIVGVTPSQEEPGPVYDKWLELVDDTGAPVFGKDIGGSPQPSRVHISLQFRPVRPDGSIALRADTPGTPYNQVPRTYFPMRPGNRITLYHDSTCVPGPVDGIQLAGGKLFCERSCWDDIYDAIMQAERFVWITGWSVWTKTMLRRRPMAAENSPTLGDLLKDKAEAGVKVLMLVWDDTSNNTILPVGGIMGTHDNETHAYFKGSKVVCVLCPRQGGTEDSFLQKQVRGNMFTHHQKTVIVDGAMQLDPGARHASMPVMQAATSMRRVASSRLERAGSRILRAAHRHQQPGVDVDAPPTRRLVAFVGGLDLTEGRYDTHDHPLFATRHPGGPHEQDSYQGCIQGLNANEPFPREPWHDIHARVEGPVAADVAINFLERWFKQAGLRNRMEVTKDWFWQGVLLPESVRALEQKREAVKYELRGHIGLRVQAIQQVEPTLELPDVGEESWNVQLFRSIDSDSAEGFPRSGEGSFEAGLSVGKGKSIDASIHRSYIALIRGAKRYLYLENQYFLGSAHLWDSDRETPCYNQVPAEIALKIVQKIKAGEPFRVYIIIPMFPEGIPTSGSVQAILYFQAKTRQMMYRRIAAAIEEVGLKGKAHPQDYLQFFCLGKRETNEMYWGENRPDVAGVPVSSPPPAATPTSNGTSSTTVHPFEIQQGAPDTTGDTAKPLSPAGAIGLSNGTAAAEANGLQEGVPQHPQQHTQQQQEKEGADGGISPAAPSPSAESSKASSSGAALPAGPGTTPQQHATAAKRFMVYVHSKLMIVDDEYIVVGSANINQRSLDGTRDSEICIGAFQPAHTLQGNPQGPLPQGEVAGFRKALWLEHLGALLPVFDDPSSAKCMNAVTYAGNENWATFVDPGANQLLPHGHLLTYPTWADENGNVKALEGCEEFPDLGGKIMGTKSGVLPPVLTT